MFVCDGCPLLVSVLLLCVLTRCNVGRSGEAPPSPSLKSLCGENTACDDMLFCGSLREKLSNILVRASLPPLSLRWEARRGSWATPLVMLK